MDRRVVGYVAVVNDVSRYRRDIENRRAYERQKTKVDALEAKLQATVANAMLETQLATCEEVQATPFPEQITPLPPLPPSP